jgi:hypothetical protein
VAPQVGTAEGAGAFGRAELQLVERPRHGGKARLAHVGQAEPDRAGAGLAAGRDHVGDALPVVRGEALGAELEAYALLAPDQRAEIIGADPEHDEVGLVARHEAARDLGPVVLVDARDARGVLRAVHRAQRLAPAQQRLEGEIEALRQGVAAEEDREPRRRGRRLRRR